MPCGALETVVCDYLEVKSVAMLGLGPTLQAARWRTWMTPEEMAVEILHRRKMLHRMGAAYATVLLLPVSELVAGAQLLDAYPQIGGGELAFARRTATDLAVVYATRPDADAVRAAKAHAYTLLDRLEHATMSPQIEVGLRAVASDAASLAGYGDLNAGRLLQAERWFDVARELAQQAGDRRLEALALVGLASISGQALEPDHAAALTDLEAAAEFHPFLPPAGRTFVFAFLSELHADLRHDLVSGRFLELARAAPLGSTTRSRAGVGGPPRRSSAAGMAPARRSSRGCGRWASAARLRRLSCSTARSTRQPSRPAAPACMSI
jgi:hypothetical protein